VSTAHVRIAELGRVVVETVRALVNARRPVAIVGFPNYPNVGDSAIYLGQLALLRAIGVSRPVLVCDALSYDETVLRRAIGDGVILLTGGGNFGDLWPDAQHFRERVIAAFPKNPIVQLPQTVHFESKDWARRARALVGAHRSFTLLARDEQSLDLARHEVGAESVLCPDVAFCLGALERASAPSRDLLWLMRSDKESASREFIEERVGPRDWLDEEREPLRELSYHLAGPARSAIAGPIIRPLLARTYVSLANRRLRRGLELLASGRAIITDRLHGHVLSLMMGIPHVLVGDRFGKLEGFHRTWTSGIDGVRWAGSAERALDIAQTLAAPAARASWNA
jgi:pyruvyl transferase EpsO